MSENINFMITSQELNQALNSSKTVVIIDVRSNEEYIKGHIPNAISIPEIFTYLPTGLTSKKQKDEFINYYKDIFSKAGVQKNELVVFYEEKFTLKAPRGLTILRYLGYDENNIKVLDGGFYSWFNNNYEIKKDIVKNKSKDFVPNIKKDFFVDYNQMLKLLNDPDIVLLDVRDKDEWIGISSSPYGIDFAPKKGRLLNAVWIQWYDFITNDMLSVKNLNKVQYKLDKKNIRQEDNIILYCFKGARLSNSYIALRRLGYENIRIYFAGWNEWCRIDDAPYINEVENDNNPLLQENIALKKKIDKLQKQKLKLVNFPKYNNEPIFAFDRYGNICFENEPKKTLLQNINSFDNIVQNATTTQIYNIIDNNETINTTYKQEDKYFTFRIIGSRDENKILVYGFDTSEINKLNKKLDNKIVQLNQSKEIFRLLYDTAPIFINSFDENGKCILWNKECENIFGWSFEYISSLQNPFELFYPDLVQQQEAKENIKINPQGDFKEWTPINKNGKKLVSMWTHVHLSNGQIINIGYDITKIRSDEKKYLEQSKLAALGEMIGNIAHQWRQPLSVISTATTGMRIHKEFGVLTDEEFETACVAIEENVKYLSKTIDDFRNFIKGDSKIVQFNLKEEIDSFLQLIQPDLKTLFIKAVIQVDENINITGYPNELKQCLMNLYNNSKDALIQNEKIEKRYIFLGAKEQKNKVEILFKDNAGGIDEEIISKIFEPYFTTKHQSQGTGLGLHMTYKLILDGMKGKIEASNNSFVYDKTNYKGARFKISIPLTK